MWNNSFNKQLYLLLVELTGFLLLFSGQRKIAAYVSPRHEGVNRGSPHSSWLSVALRLLLSPPEHCREMFSLSLLFALLLIFHYLINWVSAMKAFGRRDACQSRSLLQSQCLSRENLRSVSVLENDMISGFLGSLCLQSASLSVQSFVRALQGCSCCTSAGEPIISGAGSVLATSLLSGLVFNLLIQTA